MRAASSPAAKRVQTKCVAALIAAAMDFMMNSHHPHAWTTPVDVRTAGCAMAMFRRQTAAANSTIRKGSAVGPTRWRGASMPAVGLGRVGWPPVGFGARQQARRGPQAYGHLAFGAAVAPAPSARRPPLAPPLLPPPLLLVPSSVHRLRHLPSVPHRSRQLISKSGVTHTLTY